MDHGEKTGDLKHIIKQWESLRLAYNIVLLIEGVLVYFWLVKHSGPLPNIFNVVVFGISANAFFSFGPLLELYLSAYGYKMGKTRYVVFAIGLVFSIAIILGIAALARS